METMAGQAILHIMPWSFHAAWSILQVEATSYYLMDGGAKGEMLVNFLMPATMKYWKLTAAVCDMGANNVKALKHLGVSEKTLFVRFQNQ